MEVITLESKAFKTLAEKIDKIADYVINKSNSNTGNVSDEVIWVHNKDAANILQISTRTLQRLRSENMISYSLLRGRCFYPLSELDRIMKEGLVIADPSAIETYRANYYMKAKKG